MIAHPCILSIIQPLLHPLFHFPFTSPPVFPPSGYLVFAAYSNQFFVLPLICPTLSVFLLLFQALPLILSFQEILSIPHILKVCNLLSSAFLNVGKFLACIGAHFTILFFSNTPSRPDNFFHCIKDFPNSNSGILPLYHNTCPL